MKKMFLMLIAVTVGTLSGFAQSDLVATLSHGSNLSTYYGADALSEAYTAAAEGDVITLSSGTFNAVNIEKAITVRGAGMIPMEGNSYVTTEIGGAFDVTVPSSSSVLTLEGIHCLGYVNMTGVNLVSVNILRCRFEGLVGDGVNMNAYSCIFSGLTSEYWNGNTILNCRNCVIGRARSLGYHQNGQTAKIIATNCLVGSAVANDITSGCVFKNSVIEDSNPLTSTNSAQNCVGINGGYAPNIFENLVSASNVMVEGEGETACGYIFKTLRTLYVTSNISPNETFELTPTAAATYLGDDGKQVGIYGGANPFDPTPTNPQIKKFTVDSSVNNGKLSVKINVE